MNMWLRVLWTWLRAVFFLPAIADPLAPARLTFHVLPQDLDINWHMNNGRYLQIMDLGRYDWLLRTRLWAVCKRERWQPILAALQIRYRQPLDPFQRYDLETRVLGWTDTRCFIEQRFIRTDGVIAAIATLSAAFYAPARKTSVPMGEVLQTVRITAQSPTLPDYITSWQTAETDLKKATAR